MSARTDLVTALIAGLPANYRVTGSPDVPDQVDPGTFGVRVWASKVAPAPQSGSVQIDLTVWVITAMQAPGLTDDALDEASDAVMSVLYRLAWLTPPTAERGVMGDDAWHGWRYEVSAFGQITLED